MESAQYTIFPDGRPVKARRGFVVSRERHQGISFVNTTARRSSHPRHPGASSSSSSSKKQQQQQKEADATAAAAAAAAAPPVPPSRVKFVRQRGLARPGGVPGGGVTDEDIRRAQTTKRTIASKDSQSWRDEDASSEASSVIPYQSVAAHSPDSSFSLPLLDAWTQLNDADNIGYNKLTPPRILPGLPDWALHNLPGNVSDEGKRCFHAYLYSCPVRHYPFEQLQITSWQPFAWDQTRFRRLSLEPVAMRCTLTMGALFLLLKAGRRESAGFAMHCARLCSLVNKLLGSKDEALDKTVVVVQSVACLALLATFLGLYDHWYEHVKGLKLLVQAAGGWDALPAPVQLLAKKADLSGASEIATLPVLDFVEAKPLITDVLPQDKKDEVAAAVRRAVGAHGTNDQVCSVMTRLASFLATIEYASAPHRDLKFNPVTLMDGYHSVEHLLLKVPGPIQTHAEAMQRVSAPAPLKQIGSPRSGTGDLRAQYSPQIALRLTALFYLKIIKGGPSDTLGGSVHLVELLTQHLRQAMSIPLLEVRFVHGLSRGALIWICLVADRILRTGDSERWFRRHGTSVDLDVCRDFLCWALGGDAECVVGDEDLEMCRVLGLGRFQDMWDPRVQMECILRSDSVPFW